jgi:hypothetical protein
MQHLLVNLVALGTALVITAPSGGTPQTVPPPIAHPGPAASPPAALSAAEPGTGVRVRTLSPRLVHGRSAAPSTDRLDTAPFSLVALTWRGPGEPDFLVRTRPAASRWTAWREVHPLGEDGPDVGSSEARHSGVNGTNLVWVGESHGVQVKVPGGAPEDLKLVLIDAGRRPGDSARRGGASVRDAVHAPDRDHGTSTAALSTAATAGTRTQRAASDQTVPPPVLRFRHEWGADESLRSDPPTYNTAMKQAHVHHTAGTNDYRRSDVPAIIRGMYAYHTRSLGWSDIGYNFVVDRFGRIWVGRAGGARHNVRGAHTLGFNHQSFGVAAIGNFEHRGPSAALVRGVSRLAAWKLDRAGRRPAGRIGNTSLGSHKYPAGTKVVLPVIDGHRDTGATACPGEVLYERLPRIRKRAQTRVDSFG